MSIISGRVGRSRHDEGKKASALQRLLRSEGLKGYLFISPWIVGFLAFGLWPLLNTFYNSFTKYDLFGSPIWIGLKNYQQIFFHDPVFAQVSLNMLLYVTASTVISISGGLLLALLLNREFPGNHIFRVLLYVPSLMVGVAIALMFKQIFASGNAGLVNLFLQFFHLGPYNWLQDYNFPLRSLISLILVNLWFVGGTMLIFLAGLKGISQTYYEAAKIDGAGSWRTFRYVTLPLLSPVIVFNTILTLIGHIQVFETPLAFAVGGSGSVGNNSINPLGYHDSLGTFLTYLYLRAFVYGDFGYASALAVIVFVLTLILTLLVLLSSKRFTFYAEERS